LTKKLATVSVASKLSSADKTALKDAVLRAAKRDEGDMGLEIVDVEIRKWNFLVMSFLYMLHVHV
jgi:hypothetical protein